MLETCPSCGEKAVGPGDRLRALAGNKGHKPKSVRVAV